MASLNNTLSQSQLKEVLHYDPLTGLFVWLIDKSRIRIGDIAGHKSSTTGYIYIKINQQSYAAHRLAFLYMIGDFPPELTDHEDHVRHNNKWENLNLATNKENAKNCSRSKRNKSGVTGISWNAKNKKWQVQIRIDDKDTHLGQFADFFEACCARKSAENKHNFHPNHGK